MPTFRRLAGSLLLCLLGLGALFTPAAGTDRMLYFGEVFNPSFSDGAIHRVFPDGSGLETVVNTGGGLRGIAVDDVAGKLYWTDVSDHVIRRSNLDGSNIETIIATDLLFPYGITLDHDTDRLYWADLSGERIGFAHLDGSGAITLMTAPVGSGIALDMLHSKLYFTTAYIDATGAIMRSNLDGSSPVFVVTGHDRPSSIALDVMAQKVYWTDYVVDVVRRADFDGSDVEDLYVVGANLNPDGITLDLGSGRVYWGQSVQTNREKIMYMNLDGSDVHDFLPDVFGIVTGLAFVELPSSDATAAFSTETAMLRCVPNPFADRTSLRFDLATAGIVRLAVYSSDGRRLTALADGVLSAGSHDLSWDGTADHGVRVPGGVYYWRLEAEGKSRSGSVILRR